MAFRPSEGSVFPELVLFVARDGSVRRSYIDMLGEFGFRLETAESVQEAFDQSVASAPDAVVCVDGDGGLDGFALGRLLKRDPRTRDIPYIVVGRPADSASVANPVDSALGADCLPETVGAEIRRLLVIGRENRLRMLGVQLANVYAHRHYSEDWDRSTDRAAAVRERVSSRFRTFLKVGSARCPQCGRPFDLSAPGGQCPQCGQLLRQRGS
jgi:CheY-like chemotaxis protein